MERKRKRFNVKEEYFYLLRKEGKGMGRGNICASKCMTRLYCLLLLLRYFTRGFNVVQKRVKKGKREDTGLGLSQLITLQ